MLMSHFDRVAVAVHDSVPPTDNEWDRWLSYYRSRPGLPARALIESQHGVGPNATQRKLLIEDTRNIDVRAAILTDSLVVRGIVTAIAWLGIPQRAFPTGQFRQAGEFLQLTDLELARAVEEIAKLRAQVARARGEIQQEDTKTRSL
jgi:hypothetical protein